MDSPVSVRSFVHFRHAVHVQVMYTGSTSLRGEEHSGVVTPPRVLGASDSPHELLIDDNQTFSRLNVFRIHAFFGADPLSPCTASLRPQARFE